MAPGERIGKVVGDVFVEFVVFVVFNFRLIARPQRLRLVDFLPGHHGFTVFLFLFFNLNRQGNMVGVFADDGAHAPVIQEIVFAFTQVKGDFGTAVRFGDVINGVFAFAFRFPEDAVIRTVACCAGTYGDFVRNDERRVEAHTELADQLAVFRLIGAH